MWLFHIILAGFLSRADGWGTYTPRWMRIAKFFNAQTCSILFVILTAFYAPPLVAVAAGVAFWLILAQGFDDWRGLAWCGVVSGLRLLG
jgi:hypothetical protein